MDREEFSRRVNAMMDTLYRISYGQLREPQDRMDAIQDALLKAWAQRHRLRKPEYFETWLVRILLNACHDRQRRAKRDLRLEAAPEIAAPPREEGAEVREALLQLDEKQRTALILRYVEQYSIDDIARVLRLPRETVRSRLRRGRAKLKKLLEEGGREP